MSPDDLICGDRLAPDTAETYSWRTEPRPDREYETRPEDRIAPEAEEWRRDKNRRHLLRRLGLLAALTILLIVGAGAWFHYQSYSAAQAALQNRENFVPNVRVEAVKPVDTPRALALPGTTQPFTQATIYARQSGYIAERRVDIGSRVRAGDLLVVIAAPEVDDQLAQARAQLVQMEAALRQAQSNETLAGVTNARTATLVKQGWQSRQQGDTDRLNYQAQIAAVGVASANIAAQKAQVARLEKEQGYERVVAPFDGVITARNIDIGSLVTADATSGTALFAMAETKVLRVQVYVPQDAAFGIKVGLSATLDVPELPGRHFTGRAARTADVLQAGTRTLLVEVDVDNPDGTLTGGLYGTVDFKVPRQRSMIVIPSEALIFNVEGLQVAIFDNGKARFHKVTIAQDDGARVGIATGLKALDRVILSPPVNLADGAPVREAKE
jgi:RND family efflux transporter MFP subunit